MIDDCRYCDHPKELFVDVDCSYTIGYCSKCGSNWEQMHPKNQPYKEIVTIMRTPDDYLDFELATRYDIRYIDGYNGYFTPRQPLK